MSISFLFRVTCMFDQQYKWHEPSAPHEYPEVVRSTWARREPGSRLHLSAESIADSSQGPVHVIPSTGAAPFDVQRFLELFHGDDEAALVKFCTDFSDQVRAEEIDNLRGLAMLIRHMFPTPDRFLRALYRDCVRGAITFAEAHQRVSARIDEMMARAPGTVPSDLRC